MWHKSVLGQVRLESNKVEGWKVTNPVFESEAEVTGAKVAEKAVRPKLAVGGDLLETLLEFQLRRAWLQVISE